MGMGCDLSSSITESVTLDIKARLLPCLFHLRLIASANSFAIFPYYLTYNHPLLHFFFDFCTYMVSYQYCVAIREKRVLANPTWYGSALSDTKGSERNRIVKGSRQQSSFAETVQKRCAEKMVRV